MQTLRFVRALVTTNLKASLAQRWTFVAQAAFMVLNNVVFFIFWWVLLERVPHIRGWSLPDIALLFGMTATSYGLVVVFAGGVRFLARAIEDGELDTLLTQPQPALVYAVGMRSQASGVGDIISGIGYLALSGHVSWAMAPTAAIAVTAAAAVFLGTGIVFFSLPFWIGRTETLSRQLWELLITFALYPEPLFGGVTRLLLYTLLPAGFVSYLPVALIREPSWAVAGALIAGAAVSLAIAHALFRLGLRRYSSGSRFVVFG